MGVHPNGVLVYPGRRPQPRRRYRDGKDYLENGKIAARFGSGPEYDYTVQVAHILYPVVFSSPLATP